MEYKVYKIYDPDVDNIATGICVVDCVAGRKNRKNDMKIVKYVNPEFKDPTTLNVINCSYCNISFNNTTEQRDHYKLDWHRFNIKRALSGKQSVTKDVFDALADEISSISEFESDLFQSPDTEDNYCGSNVQKGQKGSGILEDSKFTKEIHLKAFFENHEEKIFSVYKCLLISQKEIFSDSSLITSLISILNGQKKWMFVMLGGGHFAAAVFINGKVAEHKTFHRYTKRAKNGGSQYARDNKGAGHPKSAGANLRRYNEQALIERVQEIMNTWSASIKECQLIFYRANGNYNRDVIFGGRNPPLDKNDPRLRKIPFQTKKATFKEVNRVHDVLCSLEVYGSADEFKNKYQRRPDIEYLPSKTGVSIIEKIQEFFLKKVKGMKNGNKIQTRVLTPDISLSPDLQSSRNSTPLESDFGGDNVENNTTLVSTFIEPFAEELKEFSDTVPKDLTEKESTDSKPRKKSNLNRKMSRKLFEQQFKAIQKGLIDSCNRGDKDLLIETLKIHSSLPEKIGNKKKFGKVVFTKKDFIDCLNASIDKEHGDTILHLSVRHSFPEITKLLLEAGADPRIRNKYGFTAYDNSGSEESQNLFKEYFAKYPDETDCEEAQSYSASDELRQINDQKRKEKNRLKRQKRKIKQKENKEKKEEEIEKERFLALSDREKCALAAERRILASATANVRNVKPPVLSRCFLCGIDITGKIPFEYGLNRFCSVPCVKAHRHKTNSYSLDA